MIQQDLQKKIKLKNQFQNIKFLFYSPWFLFMNKNECYWMFLNVIECYRMLLSVGTFMNVHEHSKNKVVNDQSSTIFEIILQYGNENNSTIDQ